MTDSFSSPSASTSNRENLLHKDDDDDFIQHTHAYPHDKGVQEQEQEEILDSYTPLYLPPACLLELEHNIRTGQGSCIHASTMRLASSSTLTSIDAADPSIISEQTKAMASDETGAEDKQILIDVPNYMIPMMSTTAPTPWSSNARAAAQQDIAADTYGSDPTASLGVSHATARAGSSDATATGADATLSTTIAVTPSIPASSTTSSILNFDWYQREFWSYFVDLVEREYHPSASASTSSSSAAARPTSKQPSGGSGSKSGTSAKKRRLKKHPTANNVPSTVAGAGSDAETSQFNQPNSGQQPMVLGMSLPLARIKKVMKSEDEGYACLSSSPSTSIDPIKTAQSSAATGARMISNEAPLLLAPAIEILISELSSRAYLHAETAKRKTITRQDLLDGARDEEAFDFLLDLC